MFLFHYLYKYSNIKEMSGIDERYKAYTYFFNDNTTYERIFKLNEIKKKYDLAIIMNSSKIYVNILESSDNLEPINIKNGGLFNDWDIIF
jgi:hypothetical protein